LPEFDLMQPNAIPIITATKNISINLCLFILYA
jgi:hypothetical protein